MRPHIIIPDRRLILPPRFSKRKYEATVARVVRNTGGGSGGGGETFDFYIGPAGSDSNPGTLAQPWAITALNTKRSTYSPSGVGKSIGLLSGTYEIGSLYGPGDYNEPVLDIQGSTNVGSPVIVKAIEQHGAIIDSELVGTDTRPALGNSVSRTQGNLIIDGIYFTGSVSRCVKLGDYLQSPITASVIIRNCRFSGNDARTTPVVGGNNSCLELSNQRNCQVLSCLFEDNIGETLNSADHHSAILAWKCRDCLFDGNTSVNSGSFFGKAEGFSGNVFRYNFIDTVHITAQGVALQDWCGWNESTGDPTIVHNNVLIAMSPADMRSQYVQGEEFTEHEVQFYNNTCIFSGNNSFGMHIRTSAGLLKMWNNIFVNTATGDEAFFAINVQANDTTGLIDYNVYRRSSGTLRWASYADPGALFQTRTYYTTLATMRSAMGNNGLSGLQTENAVGTASPMFMLTGTRADLYKLQSGSPYLIGAGSPGRVDGLSSGDPCERGAWGGATVPDYIGAD